MGVLDYVNTDVFMPVYQNGLPDIRSSSINAICSELYFAIKANEEIFIYGDYDMDGFNCNLVWEEVLSTLYDVRPIHFQYSTRQHTVDRDILQQVRRTSARVVIICDSGSGAEDRRVINTLIAQGYTPIVIDHHVYVGDYEQDRMVFKMYNSFEEIGLLGGAEVSGAYASLLVASHLCKHYFHRSLSFNAMVYALGSMYSDVVDMSSAPGRALYNVVASTKLPGPGLMIALNRWNYAYTRRFFSYIVGPKINACFRTENFQILNRAMSTRDKYVLNGLAEDFQEGHSFARKVVDHLTPQFKRERYGDTVLAVHIATEETLKLHVRNFSGLIANKIAKEEKCLAVVVIRIDNTYSGSFRDFYNRKLLDTFRVFCAADGHDQAFGLTFHDLGDFRRHLALLSKQLEANVQDDCIVLSGSLVKTEDDVCALALYNEYMNVQPGVRITHRCPKARLLQSKAYRKFYDVGLPMQVQSTSPLVEGSNILVEPCMIGEVELRCVD